MSSSLWSTAGRARNFVIPDDRELPPGDLLLRTLTGKRLEVDPAAAAAFEVSAEEAKTWAQAELKQVLGEIRGKIQGGLDGIRRSWEEKAADRGDEDG
jgi:hypothetical protein